MQEFNGGIHHWQAPHPEWQAGEGWDRLVSCYAIDDGRMLVLVDPLGFPEELTPLASERAVVIVLTCPWHRRDAALLSARFDALIHVPPPEAEDRVPVSGEVYRAGDALPGGITALAGIETNDLILWIERLGVIIAGDSLVDRGAGLEVPSEWVKTTTRAEILETLQPLLHLPVNQILPTHGDPVDGAALERALS